MHVHDFPNLKPSVCFMCEQAPQETKFLDTMREFDPGSMFSHLSGRKYICETCARDFAHALGVFDAEKARYEEQITTLKIAMDAQEERLAGLEHVNAVIEQLTQPKPTKKKAAEA